MFSTEHMGNATPDLEQLRQMLGQNAPFSPSHCRPTGLESFDRSFGGLPKGGLVLIQGLPGSGRTSLVAQLMAQETSAGRPVAWIDARGTLYPPALEQADITLSRLLLIRSEPDRALYAAEQILESGLFRMTAILGVEAALNARRARRLQLAAESGQSSGLIIAAPIERKRSLPTSLELETERKPGGISISARRSRNGPGRRSYLPIRGTRSSIPSASTPPRLKSL